MIPHDSYKKMRLRDISDRRKRIPYMVSTTEMARRIEESFKGRSINVLDPGERIELLPKRWRRRRN